MSAIASGTLFFQSWVIKLENFGILEKIVEGHGLTATIVKEKDKNGLFIIPGQGDQISVFVTGDRKVEPSERMDLFNVYYFRSGNKIEGRRISAKEK